MSAAETTRTSVSAIFFLLLQTIEQDERQLEAFFAVKIIVCAPPRFYTLSVGRGERQKMSFYNRIETTYSRNARGESRARSIVGGGD